MWNFFFGNYTRTPNIKLLRDKDKILGQNGPVRKFIDKRLCKIYVLECINVS
jgi:hypothetical protein